MGRLWITVRSAARDDDPDRPRSDVGPEHSVDLTGEEFGRVGDPLGKLFREQVRTFGCSTMVHCEEWGRSGLGDDAVDQFRHRLGHRPGLLPQHEFPVDEMEDWFHCEAVPSRAVAVPIRPPRRRWSSRSTTSRVRPDAATSTARE